MFPVFCTDSFDSLFTSTLPAFVSELNIAHLRYSIEGLVKLSKETKVECIATEGSVQQQPIIIGTTDNAMHLSFFLEKVNFF